MSDVSKTNELIARLRNQSTEIGDRVDVQDLMEEAADALATRVPVQGEPNDDREAHVKRIILESLVFTNENSEPWAQLLAENILAALDVAPEPEWEGCDCHPTEMAHLQAAYDELKPEHQELRKRHREGVKSLCSECLDNLAMDEFGLPVEGESKL